MGKSKAFTRSQSGLKNFSTIKGNKVIVYCESPNDIEVSGSSDAKFWDIILRTFSPTTPFVIKPYGNKKSVLEVADKLFGQVDHNSIVVIDSDYDHIKGITYPYSNLINTFGYSYENEICDIDVVCDAIITIHTGLLDRNILRKQLQEKRDLLTRKMRWVVIADMNASARNKSIIDKKKYKSIFNASQDHTIPSLRKEEVINRIKLAKETPTQAVLSNRTPIDINRHIYGHLQWWLTYRTAKAVLKEHYKCKTLDESAFLGSCINSFAFHLRAKSTLSYEHYHSKVSVALKCVTSVKPEDACSLAA